MSERIINVSHSLRDNNLVYNGISFRSDLEKTTAINLDLLGIPYEYETKRITLLEGFYCPFQKDKVRAIHYTPDFIINSNIIIECKGFEPPEWNNKKKYIYRYLMDNEPGVMFYQIHDSGKSLLAALDNHFSELGYEIEVFKKPSKRENATYCRYISINRALEDLELKGVMMGSVMSCLLGKKEYVLGYNFKLVKK